MAFTRREVDRGLQDEIPGKRENVLQKTSNFPSPLVNFMSKLENGEETESDRTILSSDRKIVVTSHPQYVISIQVKPSEPDIPALTE